MVNVENNELFRVIPWDKSANVTAELVADVEDVTVDVVVAAAGVDTGVFVSGSISSSDGT